jgi:hypothetical protein
MFASLRNALGRSRTGDRLLTLFHALSIAVGLAVMWMALGPLSLYCLASTCTVALLMVYLMRVSDDIRVDYWTGLVWGVMAACWTVLAVAFAVVGVLWVAALLLTTAPARAWCRRVLGGAETPPPAPGGDPSEPRSGTSTASSLVDVPGTDLESLCRAWRRSYFQLLDAGTTPETAEVVDYRRQILDEIDQRDPRGLRRWLASGPRASGNPLPYLRTRATSEDPGAPGAA